MKSLILLTFIFLSSCAYLSGKVQNPIVNLKKVDVQDLSFDKANLVFNFAIENPNKMALNIDQVTYNLELNEKPFAQGVFDEKINLKPESSTSVALPVKIKYTDFMHSVSDYLQDKNIHYKLGGSVKMGALSIPFNNKGIVEIDK
jgi:LEA14-like dessication related protein